MRKQELIHLHRLGFALREELESTGEVSPDAFAAYDDLDVRPTSVYRGKDAHREAIGCLLACLGRGIPIDRDERVAGSPER